MIRLESKAKSESTHKYKSLLLTGFAIDRTRFVVVSYRFGQNHQLERIKNVEQTENTPSEEIMYPSEEIMYVYPSEEIMYPSEEIMYPSEEMGTL